MRRETSEGFSQKTIELSDLTGSNFLALCDHIDETRHGRCLKVGQKERFEEKQAFDSILTYKKIIKIAQRMGFKQESLREHFSEEVIKQAIFSLERSILAGIFKKKLCYGSYCLQTLKNGWIPLGEDTWKKTTARNLLRSRVNEGARGGLKIYDNQDVTTEKGLEAGKWHVASEQAYAARHQKYDIDGYEEELEEDEQKDEELALDDSIKEND